VGGHSDEGYVAFTDHIVKLSKENEALKTMQLKQQGTLDELVRQLTRLEMRQPPKTTEPREHKDFPFEHDSSKHEWRIQKLHLIALVVICFLCGRIYGS